MGCGALKELSPTHGEVKSMRTATNYLRKGVAKAILQHILTEAKERGYTKVSLETGTMDAFKPAHRLYENFGFYYCEPFASYVEDPNSVFVKRIIHLHRLAYVCMNYHFKSGTLSMNFFPSISPFSNNSSAVAKYCV